MFLGPYNTLSRSGVLIRSVLTVVYCTWNCKLQAVYCCIWLLLQLKVRAVFLLNHRISPNINSCKIFLHVFPVVFWMILFLPSSFPFASLVLFQVNHRTFVKRFKGFIANALSREYRVRHRRLPVHLYLIPDEYDFFLHGKQYSQDPTGTLLCMTVAWPVKKIPFISWELKVPILKGAFILQVLFGAKQDTWPK